MSFTLEAEGGMACETVLTVLSELTGVQWPCGRGPECRPNAGRGRDSRDPSQGSRGRCSRSVCCAGSCSAALLGFYRRRDDARLRRDTVGRGA